MPRPTRRGASWSRRRTAESLIHGTEKSVKDHGQGRPDHGRGDRAVDQDAEGGDGGDDPERIRARAQDLTEAAMKLGEAIYSPSRRRTPPRPGRMPGRRPPPTTTWSTPTSRISAKTTRSPDPRVAGGRMALPKGGAILTSEGNRA